MASLFLFRCGELLSCCLGGRGERLVEPTNGRGGVGVLKARPFVMKACCA